VFYFCLMKKIFFVLMMLIASFTKVQAQFFNNSNNELCIKLYERKDAAGPYMVYLVLEDLNENDTKLLEKWESLNQTTRSSITQRWVTEGKRVEVIRAPYIMYPPVFPRDLKKPELKPLPPRKNVKDPWNGKFPVEI